MSRLRRRRELGMSRNLLPSDDPSLMQVISYQQKDKKKKSQSPTHRSELAKHMENARRGVDLVPLSSNANSANNQKRALTTSPKTKSSAGRVSRRSDTLPLGGELRKMRLNDVNRKMNERTKSDLAEIKKIAEMANQSKFEEDSPPKLMHINSDEEKELSPRPSIKPNNAIDHLANSINRIHVSHDMDRDVTPPRSAVPVRSNDVSPVKHPSFVQEESIYYDPEEPPLAEGANMRNKVIKTRSMEKEVSRELSPILRRKSSDTTVYQAHNHIVSILKKKDASFGESSSNSSNASPVTFSANVMDTPLRHHKKAGILKKRSSLDESRYYSRSHSPDERSILIKSARRNSLEETAAAALMASNCQQHASILKQSSYDSNKSDGCPSADHHPQGILKKKDSNSTPSDGGNPIKHVSISQAVMMAAAELVRGFDEANDDFKDNDSMYAEEQEIRPILKQESISSDEAARTPKPILKKKSFGESDEQEIKPILKSSRKSSREEFELGDFSAVGEINPNDNLNVSVRPILKTESPSKRRSLSTADASPPAEDDQTASSLKRRTRSLERSNTAANCMDLAEALNAISNCQASSAASSLPGSVIKAADSLSVADRIRNMEQFIACKASPPGSDFNSLTVNTSFDSSPQYSGSNSSGIGAVPKLIKPSAMRRDLYKERYKTQPVTIEEKNL